jgi:hypothetical protein
VVLAAVATVTADRLHGRSLAMHVLLASAFLIGGLALVSVIAAGVSAAWQVQPYLHRGVSCQPAQLSPRMEWDPYGVTLQLAASVPNKIDVICST